MFTTSVSARRTKKMAKSRTRLIRHAVAAVLLAAPSNAPALDIILNFDNAQSANPSFDSDQSGLISLFQFAEQYYQDKVVTGHTLTINYWYENLSDTKGTLGLHSLVSQSGGRETEGNIRIDNTINGVNRNWFIDPTPSSNTEFTMQQTFWRDLSATQKDDLYTFGSGIPQTFEVGFTGAATAGGGASGATDMLSVILHEVGHALGLSSSNDTTVSQTTDGDYDFYTSHVFGKTLAVEVANIAGDDNDNIAHLESNWAMMNPSISGSTRILPSHTDFFAIASGGLFSSLDVPRREFYGGGDWNTTTNWSGNSVPGSDDDVFARNADGGGNLQVGLTAAGFANNITVSEGADIDTNAFKLDATGVVTVTGAGSGIVIDVGGELEANQVVIQDGATISMLTGTLDTNTLSIAAGCELVSVFANPTIDVATSLTNNGTIQAVIGTMTFVSAAANPWNLDGTGDGVLNANGGNIHVDTGGMSGSFLGTMHVGAGHFIRIDAPWTLGAGGVVNLTGDATDPADAAVLSGGGITMQAGTINVSGIGHIDAPFVMTGGLISLPSSDTLDFNSSFTFSGGTITAGEGSNINFDSTASLSGNAFFRTHSDNAADGDIVFNGTTTYAGGNVTFAGATTARGIARHDGNVVVSDDTTVIAGTFDMDGSDGTNNTWTINKAFLLNTDRVETLSIGLGNVVNSTFNINNPGTLLIGSSSGGSLTVNLPGGGAWSLAGTANLDGSVPVGFPLITVIPDMIAGSDVNISGTINMQDRGSISARIGLSGTINTADADSIIRLNGGDISNPNTLVGGLITGPGTLGSTDGHALVGRGTINTRISFAGTSSLLADNGTLVINGAIEDMGVIGTADTDGILHVTYPWNTNVADRLELQGGSVIGDALESITNGTATTPGLIIGFGSVNVHQVVNDGRIAAKGGALVLDFTLNPDLDGGGGNGIIEAVQGDLHIADPVTDLFDGTATVGAGRTMTFAGGWTLSTGTLNLNGGNSSSNAARIAGLSQNIRGTVNVDQIAMFDLPTIFTSTAQVNLPDFADILRLDQDATIPAGATFTGGGKLSNVSGSTLRLQNGANIGVRLENNGLIEIGDSPGVATVAAFTQLFGSLHMEISGLVPGTGHDQFNVTGQMTLAGGTLDVSLLNGFVPAMGNSFDLFNFGSVTGTFSTIDLPALGAGLAWDLSLLYITGVIAVDTATPPRWNTFAGGAWTPAGNWIGNVPDSAGAPANFLSKITSPATITLDGNRTVGSITFDNSNSYTLAPGSGGTLHLDNSPNAATVNVILGSHTVNVPVSASDDVEINVASAAQLSLAAGINLPGTLTKTGAGQLDIRILVADTLDIQSGVVRMVPGGEKPSTSMLDGLILAPGALLDLTDNDLVLNYTGASPYSAYASLISNGGISTSLPHPIPDTDATIALVDNQMLHITVWNGQIISDGNDFRQLIFAYTYVGDVNLDGTVDHQDYVNIIANMGHTGATWFDGDVTGDGLVTVDDFVVVNKHFGAGITSGQPLAVLFTPEGATVVPEPAGLSLLSLAVLGLFRRRR